ncbi:MAG: alpha-glucan family phosphorylase, partial [Candidatus Cloacimonetes bacterium]|nr:alpha-glucan family phosphorylase [Candidatus Cloacimonadota bacterium]
MITFIRDRIQKLENERGIVSSATNKKSYLHAKYLTIGFARRFAEYKRANLLLKNPERLLRILSNTERPVQFIFAGKAHPADVEGKKLIKNLIEFGRQNNVEDRFVFIEGYDMNVARHIVQGCDVWLNTPVKPMEASGTSGMKAGINGVLNCSVLDGWWPECYDGTNGWAINAGDFYTDYATAQTMEAEQIYDLIEYDIAPIFFERDAADQPLKWINMMKRSIYTVGRGFNMHRMVDEYTKLFYIPAIHAVHKLTADKNKELKNIINLRHQVDKYWSKIYIKDFFLKFPDPENVTSGNTVSIDAYVYLDEADKALFSVEVVYQYDGVDNVEIIPLTYKEKYPDKIVKFETKFKIKASGPQNLNIRVKPAFTSDIYKECHYIKWRTK